MNLVHGHELISLIIKKNRALSLEEIKEMAITQIGADANYYTCSRSDMDTDGMIDFLLSSEKLKKVCNGYLINHGNLCDH